MILKTEFEKEKRKALVSKKETEKTELGKISFKKDVMTWRISSSWNPSTPPLRLARNNQTRLQKYSEIITLGLIRT